RRRFSGDTGHDQGDSVPRPAAGNDSLFLLALSGYGARAGTRTTRFEVAAKARRLGKLQHRRSMVAPRRCEFRPPGSQFEFLSEAWLCRLYRITFAQTASEDFEVPVRARLVRSPG